jgi:serine/threonine-protein kinase
LTDDQLTRLVGTPVTDDPAGGGAGGVALQASSYGTSDHSAQVEPASCVGVVFTGEHAVYGSSEVEQIKTQTFGNLYHGSPGEPHLLQETAAVFPTAGLAQDFFNTTQTQWDSCTTGEVSASLGYENAASYRLGKVQRDDDVVSVA